MENTNHNVTKKRSPWWLLFINGIFAIILGGILLWAPAKTQQNTWILLVVVLGLYSLASGILGLVKIFQNHKQWGWRLFTSILSILAGIYILIYPAATASVLPSIILLVLGIWGCAQGVTHLISAFEGAGWLSAILGALMIIVGIILIVNFANPSYGLTLLWIAAASILVYGFVLLFKAFRHEHEPYENMYLY
jgi:uncharacterized membrane protein HdeD (DUF308 family)